QLAGPQGQAFCPPGLQITGDGTERGNLGRLALKALSLDQADNYALLLALFAAALAGR
ncbi:unnamed protein product, partial [Heterosigma akashiwo]